VQVPIALLALVPLAPAARADVLVLRDGRAFDEVKLEQTEAGITVHYQHGDVEVPRAMVLDALIEDQPAWKPQTEEEKEKAAKGLVPFEGRWISARRRDDLIKKRREEKREQIADMQSHRLWRNRHVKATRHFQFEYTVPEHLFAPYRDKMEAYFTDFAKEWKVKQPRDEGKLTVCFYNDREYFQQVSGAPYGVIGYFRFVRPMELDFYFERIDRELTEDVMYHETCHYLQKLIDVDFSYPHFPGESLAEYYGASHYDPEAKRFETGLIQEGRLTEVHRDVLAGDMMELGRMVAEERMYEHYTWGWTLVHFLMNDARYAKRFQKFVLDLAHAKDVKRELQGFENLRTVRGAEVLRVFEDRLGLRSEDDLKGLEQEWHTYVQDSLELVSYRGLEQAAVAAARANMPIKAKRLFEEAIEAGSRNPMTFHGYAELLAREDGRSRAIELWRKAIELDPIEAVFYLSLGEALYEGGRGDEQAEEEGRRLMRLALEIDPEAASWGDWELLDALDGGDEGGDDGGDGDDRESRKDRSTTPVLLRFARLFRE